MASATAGAAPQGPVEIDPEFRAQMTTDGNFIAECSGLYVFAAGGLREQGDEHAAKLYTSVSESYYRAAGVLRLMVLHSLGDACYLGNGCDPTLKIRRYVDEWQQSGRIRIKSMIESGNTEGFKSWMAQCRAKMDQVEFVLQRDRDARDVQRAPSGGGPP